MKTTMFPVSFLDHPKPTVGAELLTQCMQGMSVEWYIKDVRQLANPLSKHVIYWDSHYYMDPASNYFDTENNHRNYKGN
jgi:hypothetical protein